jgi:hypothetical protein
MENKIKIKHYNKEHSFFLYSIEIWWRSNYYEEEDDEIWSSTAKQNL